MPIPFDLWGQRGYPHADIAGESHHLQAIRSLFGNDFKPTGSEVVQNAVLAPEPGNLHDRNAVGVWIGGNLVVTIAWCAGVAVLSYAWSRRLYERQPKPR